MSEWTTQFGGKSYAVCGKPEHLRVALDWMKDIPVVIRREDSDAFKCACGDRAEWYMFAVRPTTPAEAREASSLRTNTVNTK